MMSRIILVCAVALSLAIPAAAHAATQRDVKAMSRNMDKQVKACIGRVPAGYGHFSVLLKFYGDGTLRGAPEIQAGGRGVGKFNLMGKVLITRLKACAPFEPITSYGAAPQERFEVMVDY